MLTKFFKYLTQNQFLLTFFLLAFVWLILQIKDILILLFITYIIVATFSPLVELLERKKIPRLIAALLTYVFAFGIIISLIVPLIPFFTSQIQSLITSFPNYLEKSSQLFGIELDVDRINSVLNTELTVLGQNALFYTGAILGGFFSILTILVISFYLLIDQDNIKKSIACLFQENSRKKVFTIITQIEDKLGAWLRGQMILSFSVGIITWIVLTILGLNFALPLALIAGFLEIIPILGPVLAAIPAVILAINISPSLAIAVIASYIIIQVLESNILVPKIMQRAVGLNPIVVIIAITIGGKFLGILGALLSVPFLSMLVIIFNYLNEGGSKS